MSWTLDRDGNVLNLDHADHVLVTNVGDFGGGWMATAYSSSSSLGRFGPVFPTKAEATAFMVEFLHAFDPGV